MKTPEELLLNSNKFTHVVKIKYITEKN